VSEGQAASEPEPQEVVLGVAAGPGRSGVDQAAVLLAVERVAADVAALSRALAAQPEEVAARLDVDAATAAIGVRVGALGSALDQLRLSMLAALDRATDRLDAPLWLPAVQAALAEVTPPPEGPEWLPGLHVAIADVGSRLDRPRWLADLLAALDEAASRLDRPRWLADLQAAVADVGPRLDAPAWLADLQAGLAPLAADHERLQAAVAQLAAVERSMAERTGGEPVLEAIARLDPGERLAKVERAVADLADGVRAGAAVGDALEDLGHRLAAIEDAAGRVADDARLLVERVAPVPDRLSAIASQVDRITPLARAGDQAGSLFDRLDHVGGSLVEVIALLRARGATPVDEVEERFEGVVDVLAGVTRRQDQVTAAIASVLDQVRGPKGVDAVLERMEQRERSLAARLDRIDAELRRTHAAGPGSTAEATAKPDTEAARALETVTAMVEQQERVLAFRLDQIEAELQRLREATTGAQADDQGLALEAVLERMDRQEQTVATHLDWVGERLSEVAAHLVPVAVASDAAANREDERFEAVVERLAAVARRQDDLAAAFAGSSEEARSPVGIAAVFDRMEQRERSLAARLDRIDAELRRVSQGAPAGAGPVTASAAPEGGQDEALAASVESIATTTADLATLIESTADRLDRRLARVESGLGATPTVPRAAARPTTSPEDAALRLAELRAERAQVQARLQEERLLAAQTWDDET
jgi:hypothetical protein